MSTVRRLIMIAALAVVALGTVSIASEKIAEARCTQYVSTPWGQQCVAYRPDFPPGGGDCTNSTPGVAQVYLYSGTNYTGWCIYINPVRDIPDLTVYGWGYPGTSNFIQSIKAGPLMPGTGYHAFWSQANYAGYYSLNPGNQPDTSSWWLRSMKAH